MTSGRLLQETMLVQVLHQTSLLLSSCFLEYTFWTMKLKPHVTEQLDRKHMFPNTVECCSGWTLIRERNRPQNCLYHNYNNFLSLVNKSNPKHFKMRANSQSVINSILFYFIHHEYIGRFQLRFLHFTYDFHPTQKCFLSFSLFLTLHPKG